ncbi:hypothetical protein ZIOFF_021151 [Zingiber officinale]|uniref:BTB/POZ domain-containing protein n=1 Tax=Zingiber officinale TaxID=94328 RepID=A0A8J5H122_ZINOF|nr:hypothetical protein ZIOFF_021151 [Zingiber officinale]
MATKVRAEGLARGAKEASRRDLFVVPKRLSRGPSTWCANMLWRGAKETEPWAEHLTCKHALARGQRSGAMEKRRQVDCSCHGPKNKRNMLTLGVDPMQHYDGASTWVQAATWHGANGSQRHLDMAVLKIKKAGRVTRSKNLRKLKRVAKAITKNEKAWTTAATAGTESSSSTLANQETMASMTIGSKPETFQLEGQTWKCLNELSSDVVIEVGEMTFYLHKFPLLNRSGLLRKAISEFRGGGGGGGEGKDSSCILQLHDIPGGAKAFELVAKFCYDVRIELNALNVVSLRCAAEHLCMTEDLAGGNLIFQTEKFLDQIFASWKDSTKALEACESVLPQAEDLQIVSRCINSLASKACADSTVFGCPAAAKTPDEGVPAWNGIVPAKTSSSASISDWWYEDVLFLSLPLFKRLILAMEAKGMKPESIAGALMFYAKRFLPGLSRNLSFRAVSAQGEPVSAPSESDQRVFIEEIVDLLPMRKGVTTSTFLLNMLRTAMILRASASCRENLERRIGSQLDEATLEDILIPNLGYSVETLYDIDCVQRILDHFMQIDQSPAVALSGVVDEAQLVPGASSPALTPLTTVAKLVDGYLAEVSTDVNLKPPKFMALTAAVPDYGRPLDDGIYRAVDIYLKSHPWLTEAEKEQLCRLMNCQKLSLEACTHAAQNERLPLRVIVQVLFFEQLRLRTSVASWFFVSDNLENPPNAARVTQASLLLQKTTSRATRAEVVDAQRRESERNVDVRQRIIDLEKECLGMKKEIEKLGKPKAAAWSIFARMKPKPRKEANC